MGSWARNGGFGANPFPPELVWRAIALPEGFDAWLMKNDFRGAKAGHRFQFTDRPRPLWDGICERHPLLEGSRSNHRPIAYGTTSRVEARSTSPQVMETNWLD
jgi:hypothetical protein